MVAGRIPSTHAGLAALICAAVLAPGCGPAGARPAVGPMPDPPSIPHPKVPKGASTEDLIKIADGFCADADPYVATVRAHYRRAAMSSDPQGQGEALDAGARYAIEGMGLLRGLPWPHAMQVKVDAYADAVIARSRAQRRAAGFLIEGNNLVGEMMAGAQASRQEEIMRLADDIGFTHCGHPHA